VSKACWKSMKQQLESIWQCFAPLIIILKMRMWSRVW
jgi:hypothetical protein